jgi:hypothetical protein
MVGRFKLRVNAPCSESWNAMTGGGDQRFCGRCEQRVHNLSAMTADAAVKVLASPDERLCVRFETRGDGTAVIGGESRLRRALRIVGLVALGLWFWATVVLVQLPWLALTRRAMPVSPKSPQQQSERDRKELELAARAAVERARLIAVIKSDHARNTVMGGMPKESRHHFIREVQERRHHGKKQQD